MKTTTKITGLMAVMLMILTVSCKDENDSTQSVERPGYENEQQDSLNAAMRDTVTIDTNMEGQSDTHGRDTDAGDAGTEQD